MCVIQSAYDQGKKKQKDLKIFTSEDISKLINEYAEVDIQKKRKLKSFIRANFYLQSPFYSSENHLEMIKKKKSDWRWDPRRYERDIELIAVYLHFTKENYKIQFDNKCQIGSKMIKIMLNVTRYDIDIPCLTFTRTTNQTSLAEKPRTPINFSIQTQFLWSLVRRQRRQ